MRGKKFAREKGFALIEILVAMAIITILAGLLLPALSRARTKAKYGRWLDFSDNLRAHPEGLRKESIYSGVRLPGGKEK